MKFAAFFMAEYANIITACSVATTLFLGGWHPIIPNELGGQFIPTLVCLFFAGSPVLHALNPARPSDRISMGVIGAIILGLGLLFQVPGLKDHRAAHFLVRLESRLPDLPFHLGPRHGASFPLRPTDALRLARALPGGID
jgi:hypothetical protein